MILLNDIKKKKDIEKNGEMYALENEKTHVVYRAYNTKTKKSYIGKASSYIGHGYNNKKTKYGAKGRFVRHLSNKDSPVAYNECPVFYDALRASEPTDWFIYTIKVCDPKHVKERETCAIKKYKTSDPKIGYNYFVGDNKPDNQEYLEKYQTKKAESNVNRAKGGLMKREEHSIILPPNIYYRTVKKNGVLKQEGYVVRIKIDGNLYGEGFLANSESMECKLEKAISQLDLFKKRAKIIREIKANKKNIKSESEDKKPIKKANISGSKTTKPIKKTNKNITKEI